MAISLDKITDLIKSPKSGAILAQCAADEVQAKKYIDGNGWVNPIGRDFLRDWEQEAVKDLRKHLEICPTLPLSKLIRDELNRGISTKTAIEELKPETNKLTDITETIWKDNDIKYFIDTFLKRAIDTDFNSFILITKGKLIEKDGKKYEVRDNSIRANNEDFTPYAIFISVSDVIDFGVKGSDIEYLLYRFDDEHFRFIDDEKDLLITKKDGNYIIIEDSIFFHKLEFCPAKQLSDLYKFSSIHAGMKAGQLSHVMGEFVSYVTQFKELKTSEVAHAHPKYWSYGFKCPVCNGAKTILNPTDDAEQSPLFRYHDPGKRIGESMMCPNCKGEGSLATVNSKEVMKLPGKIGDTQFTVSGSPAGYIQIPKDSLEYQDSKLKDLEAKILFDATGNKNIIAARMQTATEVDANVKGLQARINERQRIIESVVNFSVNTAAKMVGINSEYTYTFQRNVSYKDENTMYAEINQATAAGMPQSYINELKIQLSYIRFTNPVIVEAIETDILTNKIENGEENNNETD